MREKNRRKANLLDEALERRMALYVLAAGAALAAAPGAQGKVVYTARRARLVSSLSYFDGTRIFVDLDNDGNADFTVRAGQTYGSSLYTWGLAAYGKKPENRMVLASGRYYVTALKKGDLIGGSDAFAHFGILADKFYTSWGRVVTRGNFRNMRNRFLGLKFETNDGQLHYGWIGFRNVYLGGFHLKAEVDGYAYETEPGKPIVAGDIGEGNSDAAEMRAPGLTEFPAEPTSLELLAMGHTAIADRQRRVIVVRQNSIRAQESTV